MHYSSMHEERWRWRHERQTNTHWLHNVHRYSLSFLLYSSPFQQHRFSVSLTCLFCIDAALSLKTSMLCSSPYSVSHLHSFFNCILHHLHEKWRPSCNGFLPYPGVAVLMAEWSWVSISRLEKERDRFLLCRQSVWFQVWFKFVIRTGVELWEADEEETMLRVQNVKGLHHLVETLRSNLEETRQKMIVSDYKVRQSET